MQNPAHHLFLMSDDLLEGAIDLPVKLSNAVTNNFKILPMRSTSVTRPVAMNVAQTSIAAEARLGDESAPKAGVNAELT